MPGAGVSDGGRAVSGPGPTVLLSLLVGTILRQPMLLTKRRAVDLCRVATCLCRFA